jgi:hypothetical protein
MDDSNENDVQLTGATFDPDGTFTGSGSTRSNHTNSNEQKKLSNHSSSEEVPSNVVNTVSNKPLSYSLP